MRTTAWWTAVMIMALVPLPGREVRCAERKDDDRWHDDYRAAMETARHEQKLLLVRFYRDETANDDPDRSLERFFDSNRRRAYADRYVFARIPCSREASVDGRRQVLSRHPAFAELDGRPGLVVIDLTDVDSPHHGDVISIVPTGGGFPLDDARLTELMDLPLGSLTQRTLILAVRAHAENPGSADGRLSDLLLSEASRHAARQASIRRQGHHDWNRRFHDINARLPGGMVAQEVCAESWPGEGLMEAAMECVRSWRASPGHWSAVKRRHAVFGYDMKRGSNGVWYATGIFGHRG